MVMCVMLTAKQREEGLCTASLEMDDLQDRTRVKLIGFMTVGRDDDAYLATRRLVRYSVAAVAANDSTRWKSVRARFSTIPRWSM